jgi:hypothetical protein
LVCLKVINGDLMGNAFDDELEAMNNPKKEKKPEKEEDEVEIETDEDKEVEIKPKKKKPEKKIGDEKEEWTGDDDIFGTRNSIL